MKTYRVGGAVRDKFLGLPHQDSDWVVVGGTPERMVAAGFKPVGKDFPVFLHPQTHEEYALARTERKTGRGYHGFAIHADPSVTLEDDLRRRDLTINAMAEDESGALIDPFGGLKDLQARILRHVSPAFSEDPVRILRVARFAARFAGMGFVIADETIDLMRQMVDSGEVDALVPERVWQEFARALGERTPSEFLRVLRNCGALARLFPEIDRLFGVPQRVEYHPEVDTGIHALMVVDRAAVLSKDARIRFAALVHDLGKGTTPAEILPRHTDHETRSVDLVRALCQRLRVPNDYRDLALIVARGHGTCHRALELRPGTVLRLLSECDAFRRPERFESFLIACQADAQGRLGRDNDPYPQADLLREAFAAARAIDARRVAEQRGLAGEALGAAIEHARLEAITAVVHRYHQAH